jgi:hypothetical protein
MGYRSDVTMVMYTSAGHKDKFAALKLYVDENLPDQFEVREGEKGEKYLLLMFRDEADPEGEAIFHYEFMRIGEEYADVVYDCSYGSDHLLNMGRKVYIDL